MRIGIFFGGPSREREISFSGGKTAFEYLDQSLFEPVPVFVDSFGRFILLNNSLMYRPGIRSFYPAVDGQNGSFNLYIESFPELAQKPVPAEIGVELLPTDFGKHFDFAFLAMHGPDCEDGAIQGLLEWYRIPYSGPGLMGSALAIDKILQNDMIALVNQQEKKSWTLTHHQWIPQEQEILFRVLKKHLGLPLVIKAPHQGSSIGVAIVKNDSLEEFISAVDQCFFQLTLRAPEWLGWNQSQKQNWAQRIANLDEGIGYPVMANGLELIHHPDTLIAFVEGYFGANPSGELLLSSSNAEDQVLIEEFIEGQEFSCGCIQFDNGEPLALPPSEVVKMVDVFDFNSKYKPGASRKRIPVDTTLEKNQEIQQMITAVFKQLGMTACVRIDGFLTADGRILLHDPNTIPGMSPTSFIFKQMAEIGLDVTQALTYLVRQSLRERIRLGKNTWEWRKLLKELDVAIIERSTGKKKQIGVLFEDNNDQYQLARQRFGAINATGTQEAIPVLQAKDGSVYRLTKPMMFKDTIVDVQDLMERPRHALLQETSQRAQTLTHFFAGTVDFEIYKVKDKDLIGSIDEWVVVSQDYT
ncbi:D-alanine-D-alanine ligase [Dyadobacter jejuensis]|uniref:D-alanine--D-alanine ligase n=1 Tax=Dyadobacter jejuensis TaxID=1082580 RepID=A0A316AKI7_9BACT|nr:D-alanine--D-alanine ligase [Dyadobacter jejuensis]PWJ58283.1 D-alanine-D-alanine ligase [Dyadobacter jejuensis]